MSITQRRQTRKATLLVSPAKLKIYQLIIRCIHQRGPDQKRCLKELNDRGCWLSASQKEQAGLAALPVTSEQLRDPSPHRQ